MAVQRRSGVCCIANALVWPTILSAHGPRCNCDDLYLFLFVRPRSTLQLRRSLPHGSCPEDGLLLVLPVLLLVRYTHTHTYIHKIIRIHLIGSFIAGVKFCALYAPCIVHETWSLVTSRGRSHESEVERLVMSVCLMCLCVCQFRHGEIGNSEGS